MKVRIVCYEDTNAWILGKFARRMDEMLKKNGINSDIAKVPDNNADINHHIIYLNYDGEKHGIDTLMITHIDDIDKLNMIKQQLEVASVGICMSKDTMQYLSKMGLNKDKLCYINPAHDDIMPVKKIVVGISCRVQEDGRKRESFLEKLSNVLDNRLFLFKIMGDSWDKQVNILRKKGFEVEYHNHFDYAEYIKFIPTLDYYLYMGMDEGQMGFIDALAAGVKTIVTAQGYHLDAPDAIVHPFTNYEELESVFLFLEKEKKKLISSISSWNWEDYVKKHIEVWNYLLGKRGINSNFKDGLNSLLYSKNNSITYDEQFTNNQLKLLKKEKYLHLYYMARKKIKVIIAKDGIIGLVTFIVNKISAKIYSSLPQKSKLKNTG